MAKSKAIAKSTPTGVIRTQADLPAFMRGKAGQGVDRLTGADIEIPRIQLLQALSPQVEDGGHKSGDFFHSVAEESLSRELIIIPVYVDVSYILWRPRKSGGGILARAQDGIHWSPAPHSFDVTLEDGKTKVTWKTAATVAASGLAEWGSMDPSDPNSPPAATRMYNIVVMMPDYPEFSPAVVTLQRSAIKVAKKLMGKMKISQAPTFGMRFKMTSIKDRNAQNQEYWNYAFMGDGLVENEADFKYYEGLYERFKSEGVRIRDIEGLQTDNIPDDPAQTKGATEADKKKFAGKI